MAFVLAFVGLMLVITGVRGTVTQFGSMVAQDFSGGFVSYVAAIAAVGALGYVDALRALSRLFMALILIVLVLANKGFFAQFTAALKSGAVAPTGAGSPVVNSPSAGSAGVVSSQSDAWGMPPENNTLAKSNGWINYFISGKWIGG